MKASILILDKTNDAISQMAEGWLRSFDPELLIASAGVEKAGTLSSEIIEVMKEAGVDISAQTAVQADQYLNQSWNFLLILNHSATDDYPVFTGHIQNRIYMEIKPPEEAVDVAESIHQINLKHFCDQIRYKIFLFYLKDVSGREMLGSDSCGVECDLHFQ